MKYSFKKDVNFNQENGLQPIRMPKTTKETSGNDVRKKKLLKKKI
jgi:hypothetical protein